jgi:uncharacterized protein with PQ loop repeat
MPTLDLATGGLVVIMIAWLIQLYQVLKINKNISMYFVLAYMVGVLMLVISAYLANAPVSYFELGSFITAAVVLIAILRKK